MDDAERARHAAFRRPHDQRRFAIGCALIRLTAGAVLGRQPRSIRLDRTCPDCDQPHGKPHILGGGDLHASVSHSGSVVAVALARGAAVGIDVEELNRDLDHAALAPTVLSAGEHAATAEAFLAYWTCKEAVLKATGDGLRVPLTALTITDPAHHPRLSSWTGRPQLVPTIALYRLDPGPGHLAAVAVLDPTPRPIRLHDATPLLLAAS